MTDTPTTPTGDQLRHQIADALAEVEGWPQPTVMHHRQAVVVHSMITDQIGRLTAERDQLDASCQRLGDLASRAVDRMYTAGAEEADRLRDERDDYVSRIRRAVELLDHVQPACCGDDVLTALRAALEQQPDPRAAKHDLEEAHADGYDDGYAHGYGAAVSDQAAPREPQPGDRAAQVIHDALCSECGDTGTGLTIRSADTDRAVSALATAGLLRTGPAPDGEEHKAPKAFGVVRAVLDECDREDTEAIGLVPTDRIRTAITTALGDTE